MKQIILVPTINANDDAVVIVRWHIDDGCKINKGSPLVDIETTKAVATIDAQDTGWVKQCCKVGEELPVGHEIAYIFSEEKDLLEESGSHKIQLSAKPDKDEGDKNESHTQKVYYEFQQADDNTNSSFDVTNFSPAAKKLAEKIGINIEDFKNSNLGLVNAKILENIILNNSDNKKLTNNTNQNNKELKCERIPPAKRAEIEALKTGAGAYINSSLTIYFDSANLRDKLERTGDGMLPLILSELGKLLITNPKFTAYADSDYIYYYEEVNLGVAIDLGEGLKVVVIHNASQLDPHSIGSELAKHTLDYIENKLGLDAIQGSTFTVTDLSGLNTLNINPLINGRQSAILGIGADSSINGYPMTLTITFDHRVLTGREVALLLENLRKNILKHCSNENNLINDRISEKEIPYCDMCLTDIISYQKEFGSERYAVMLQYMRPDLTTGLICHRCQGGYT
jgi:2-oxoglutarate dehydrogenase E2 component (dihydrolipoamide succinyltransferase)